MGSVTWLVKPCARSKIRLLAQDQRYIQNLEKRKPNFLNIASVESNPTNTKAHLPKQQSKSASRLSPLSPLCYPSREHLTSSLSVKFDHRLSLLSHSFEWLRSFKTIFCRPFFRAETNTQFQRQREKERLSNPIHPLQDPMCWTTERKSETIPHSTSTRPASRIKGIHSGVVCREGRRASRSPERSQSTQVWLRLEKEVGLGQEG